MNYQMIVLDLDGTLMTSRNEITERTKNSLIRLQERGGKDVLASGRPPKGIHPLAELLELPKYGSFILAFNGSRIYDCRDYKCIFERNLPTAVIPELYHFAVDNGFSILAYDEENIYSSPRPIHYCDYETKVNNISIKEMENFVSDINFPIPKCLIVGDPEKAVLLEEKLKKRYHGILNISRSMPFFIEVNPRNTDKGNSLMCLLNGMGVNPEQVVCCGDGGNDIPMIETAGLGVAMGNAGDDVKAAADFITRSNDNNGIAYVIDKFML